MLIASMAYSSMENSTRSVLGPWFLFSIQHLSLTSILINMSSFAFGSHLSRVAVLKLSSWSLNRQHRIGKRK